MQKWINKWLRRVYRWACQQLYHEFAWSYDWVSWGISQGRWASWRDLTLEYMVGPVVLELGYGPGHLLVAGSRRGLTMVGVDASPQMALQAQYNVRRAGVQATCLLGSGLYLPVGSGNVATIVATFPAEYILHANTLAECYRVLAGGGRLVIGGLWVEHPWLQLPILYGRPAAETVAAIGATVAHAGFQPQWLEREVDGFTIGILLAEKAQPQVQQVENHH